MLKQFTIAIILIVILIILWSYDASNKSLDQFTKELKMTITEKYNKIKVTILGNDTIRVRDRNITIANNNINCSYVLTKYVIDYALPCYLKQNYTKQIDGYVKPLNRTSKIETVWNILEFVDRNIEYNKTKSKLLPVEFRIDVGNRVVITHGEEVKIQSPLETIQRGSGICSDYTILILAMLLESGINNVYAIEFVDKYPDHVAPAVDIGGDIYILDQHIPPIQFGSYLKIYNNNITKVIIFKITRVKDKVIVSKLELGKEEISKIPATEMTQADAKYIAKKIMFDISDNFNNTEINSKLPTYYENGKSDGKFVRILKVTQTYKNMKYKYSAIFSEYLTKYLYDQVVNLRIKDTPLYKYIQSSVYVYVDGDIVGNDLKITIYIAI